MNGILTTAQVAAELGISVRRVQALIWSGQLPAEKVGRDWVIQQSDLEMVRERQPGRPKRNGERQ